jgi:hypothetical protein
LATAALACGVAILLGRLNPDWSFRVPERRPAAGEVERRPAPEAAPA